MNKYFDEIYQNRGRRLRKNYSIDDKAFTKLEELSRHYGVSIAELLNHCIELMIRYDKVVLYKREPWEIPVMFNASVWERNADGIERLKEKSGVSLSRLVNIAIYSCINEIY